MKKALVLSLILAVGLSFAAFADPTMDGKWDTDFYLKLPSSGVFDLDIVSVLDINYNVGDWTFGSYTKLDTDASPFWTAQYFDAAGVLGAFSITSKLEFVPSPAAFKKWTTEAKVSIAGVSFGAKFELVPNNVQLTLTGSGVAGDVTIGVTIVLGDLNGTDLCDLDFNSVKIVVGFPFCCADVTSTLYFTCAGFDYIQFCVKGITISNFPWLTLDACLKFQTHSKTLTLSPKLDIGVVGCDFDLYTRLSTSGDTDECTPDNPLNIKGFYIDGISIACDIGGVAFTGISYWGPPIGTPADYPGILAGKGMKYWEAYRIGTTDDGCCGPFGFDVTAYFDCDADSLFDVALFEANMSLQIATQFTFDMGLTIDVDTEVVEIWKFGFLVTW